MSFTLLGFKRRFSSIYIYLVFGAHFLILINCRVMFIIRWLVAVAVGRGKVRSMKLGKTRGSYFAFLRYFFHLN